MKIRKESMRDVFRNKQLEDKISVGFRCILNKMGVKKNKEIIQKIDIKERIMKKYKEGKKKEKCLEKSMNE